jgi:hypothetical protein
VKKVEEAVKPNGVESKPAEAESHDKTAVAAAVERIREQYLESRDLSETRGEAEGYAFCLDASYQDIKFFLDLDASMSLVEALECVPGAPDLNADRLCAELREEGLDEEVYWSSFELGVRRFWQENAREITRRK